MASTFFVRLAVDVFDAFEQQAIKEEEKTYAAIETELKEAKELKREAAQLVEDVRYRLNKDVSLDAAQRMLSAATLKVEHVSKKLARYKPKQGIHRMPGLMRRSVRFMFIVAILSSVGACVSAGRAFYVSLQLEIGCRTTWGEILSFVIVGALVLPLHLLLLWIATSQP